MTVSSVPELWAGVECTVNRVGDAFFDQLECTGHARRLDDLDRLASLGVRTVRYPVLWERAVSHADAPLDDAAFRWSDERLDRLRALGLDVVVGLVHHGSGPRGTSLLDESFVTGLARFARRVAERYPWVEAFTPVNEPLTTARFSGLYGHWYPHGRDARSFSRALLTEVQATAAAMRAIRTVNPRARLVQTEDVGRVFASPSVQYQADFENERRWLSLDLLCGRVRPAHPLYGFLTRHGALTPRELSALADEPCAPDLVGVNYYVTSDRFLDDELERYAPHLRGGNGRHGYADVEAVRVRPEGIVGHRDVLRETAQRYGLPVALTEVHLGCSVDEQVRWLAEAWEGALDARRAGVDVRAVTLWSCFGACDWDSLVTVARGRYEPGVFDVREGIVRETALGELARTIATTGLSRHRYLATPGWWRRDERLTHRRPLVPAGLDDALETAIAV